MKTNGDMLEKLIEMRGIIEAHNSDKKAVRDWLEEARSGS